MSEYQRFEFMTSDRPLTRAQLDAVNALSSHIDASSTHALIEYHWGSFKHNPLVVLHDFFDGFLYWANWGAPRLAFRFPHGALAADLLDGYDLDDFVTLTQHQDCDILDIHFGELEAPEEWAEYELGSLMPIRDELMAGDTRALYIAWLGSRRLMGSYDDEEDYEISVPPVPAGLGTVSEAHMALAELLQVPEELLVAAARHSGAAVPARGDEFAAWITLLPQDRRDDYLVRLARNEPGLSRVLVRELRALSPNTATAAPSTGAYVTYATLLTESRTIRAELDRERREQEQLAHQRHLQDIHDHQDEHWDQVEQFAARGSGVGYDEAVRALVELREVATNYQETEAFQQRFRAWVQPHVRRPAFVKRLKLRQFDVPDA